MAAVGAIFGAVSAVAGGIMQSQQAKYQAEIAKMNRRIAEENARRAIDRSQIEQENNDRNTRVMLGEQEAAQAASGLSLTGRTQILTRKAARQMGRLDALNIRQAGELEAYNYKVDAANFAAAAAAKKMEAQHSLLGGFLGGLGSLVGGASSLFNGGASYTQGSSYAPIPIFKPRSVQGVSSSFGPNFALFNRGTGTFGGGV